MIEHKTTQTTKINFQQLEERIKAINNYQTIDLMKKFLYSLIQINKPTLIMATGGSKIVALYLQLLLEQYNIITEVIEPRDYFYKNNKSCFNNLVVISASGNTNGIKEALNNFKGNKFLITEYPKEKINAEIIFWGNDTYETEKSFISLATSLGPMALMLTSIEEMKSFQTMLDTNEKISRLIKKIQKEINSLTNSFQLSNLIQIMSGYDTKISSTILESNLVEVGLCAPIIHDKGSFCHGRSNLLFKYPNSPIIYLRLNKRNKLDEILIALLKEEYPNILEFKPILSDDNLLWQEFDLALQMYYLSKKIAEDKKIDLTMPEYNPRLIKSLYYYKGEM